ncbi:MAG: hypothetical protein ABEJ87_04430 [Candidatus Nanohalobium sp.]
MEGVRVGELGEKIENDGFSAVLDMTEEELLENYYDRKGKMTFT